MKSTTFQLSIQELKFGVYSSCTYMHQANRLYTNQVYDASTFHIGASNLRSSMFHSSIASASENNTTTLIHYHGCENGTR